MKSKRLIALVVGVVCAVNGVGTAVNANVFEKNAISNKVGIEDNLNDGLNDYLIKKNEKIEENKEVYNISKEEVATYKAEDKARVIVELEDNKTIKGTDEEVKAYKFDKQDNVIEKFNESVDGIEVKNRYYKGINSFSIETTYGDLEKIEQIKNLEGVKSIRLAKTYNYQMLSSGDLVNTKKVWEENKFKGEGTVVAVVDSGVDYTHKDFVLSETGLEKQKITKDAANEKISETEIDDIWLSEKIPVAYDWADGDSDVRNPYSEHGTHVAGIAAANGDINLNGIKGVAPEAQIIVEKVFGDYSGGAYDDDIAAGIYHAVEMGADVINLSLGSDAGWVDDEDISQAAIKYAAEKGVLVVAAGGNASYSSDTNLPLPWVGNPLAENYDVGLVGSPGISPYALQVASYENSQRVKAKGLLKGSEGNEDSLALYNQPRSNKFLGTLETGKDYELVHVGEGRDSDYVGKDLNGKIAVITPLVAYGTYTSFQFPAQYNGAVAVIMVPHEGSPLDKTLMLTNESIPLATTSTREEGMKLVERLDSGENVTFNITEEIIQTESPFKDTMSDFSSWGSGSNLEFKPEITAPGGNIYSTVSNNGYEEMSGTSMASPYVAGGAALVIQGLKNSGKFEGQNLVNLSKTILMNTSKVINDPATGVPYSTRKQGSGLMQLDKAVNSSAIVYRKDTPLEKAAAIELKEVSDVIEFDLVLESLGNGNAEYDVNVDLITDKITHKEYDVNEDGTIDRTHEQLDMQSELVKDATVTINGEVVDINRPYKVSLNDGEKKDLKVSIDLKTATNLKEDTFIEGFVNINSEEASDLVVPFMGFYGQWGSAKNIDAPAWEDNSFIPFTAIWNTVEDGPNPIGYNVQTGEWDVNKIGISSTSIFDAVAPKFTLLRNVDSVSIQVENSEGNVVNDLGYAEDWFGNRMKLSKSIMAYNDFNLAFAEWNGLDAEGNKLPDGDYKFAINSVGQYDGAVEERTELPIKLDNTAPVMTNIKATPYGEGTLVSWDVEETGSGFDGVVIYYDDQYESIVDSELREVYLPSNNIKELTIVAIDSVFNLSINNYGETKPVYEYLVNFGRVEGDEINHENGLQINQFSVKKLDWKVSVKNLAGEEVHSYEEKYTSNFVPAPICIPQEVKDGQYYMEIIATDEVGYSVTSEPHYFNVVGNGAPVATEKATNLIASEVGKNNVKLTWNAPTSSENIMEYVIYKDGKEFSKVPAGETLEYNATELRANTIYGFKVVARSKTGVNSKPISVNARTTK